MTNGKLLVNMSLKEGDIVRCLEGGVYFSQGKAYEVVKDGQSLLVVGDLGRKCKPGQITMSTFEIVRPDNEEEYGPWCDWRLSHRSGAKMKRGDDYEEIKLPDTTQVVYRVRCLKHPRATFRINSKEYSVSVVDGVPNWNSVKPV